MFKPANLPGSPSAPEPVSAGPRTDRHKWLLAAILWIGTVWLYWPATHNGFVNYDDGVYVTENLHVQNGLTPANVGWAFRTPVCSNWHPLTVLSHMLDCELYGLNPWGHHLTNILLHAVNAVLLFLLLNRMTGAVWRSAGVAALFAWHPLHVESVAWVAERKDVLSTCFGFLTLIAYVRYAQLRKAARNTAPGASPGGRLEFRAFGFYVLACSCFAMGLMSKPMLVTWPLVLFLLDWWPLDRMRSSEFGMRNIQKLAVEKLPFFALAALTSAVTFIVQKMTGAMSGMEFLPLPLRIENAVISYGRYVVKLFWPGELAVFYPFPKSWALGWVLLAAGFVAGISTLAWMARRRHRYLLTGWLWYLITLLPVLGVVQVGIQAMADRYSYIPSVGVFIATVWGGCELSRAWRHQTAVIALAGSAAIILCLAMTRLQLDHWRNSVALFEHSLSVTDDNYVARVNLGKACLGQNKTDEAVAQFRQAIRLKSTSSEAHNDLGFALTRKGQTNEAIHELQESIRLDPGRPEPYNNLGTLLEAAGRTNDAAGAFQTAIRINPEYVNARCKFAELLAATGQTNAALDELAVALRIDPANAESRYHLGLLLAQAGQTEGAIAQLEEAVRINPGDARNHNDLGSLLAMAGRADEAADQFQEALRLNPDYAGADFNLASLLARSGQLDAAIGRFREALRLKPDDPEIRYKLGNLLAKTGHPDEAISQFREAVKLKADFVEAHNNLGTLLMAGGNLDEALEQFEAAVHLRPEFRDPHYNLANALARKERWDDAISQYETVIRLTPDYAPAHYYLGAALARKGVADEAIRQLQEAARLQPNDAQTHNKLGELLDAGGRPDEAVSEFQQAVRLKPDYPAASNNLARLRERLPSR